METPPCSPLERLARWRWTVLVLVLFTAAIRLPDMPKIQRTGWDETAYMVFAQTWNDDGVAGIREILADYRHDKRLQQSPLPLRIAFIVAGATACQLMGGVTVDHMAWLSFGAGLALIAVGMLFARELTGNAVVGLLTGLLLAVSPLASSLSLRATEDGFMGLLTVAALWLFYRASRSASAFNLILLGVCLLVGFMTKETLAFIYPLMGCMLVWQRFVEKRKIAWLVLAPLGIAPVLYFAITAALAGGVGNYISTYRFYSALQDKLDFTIHNEKGPWHAYFVDFLALSPGVFLLAFAGLATLQPAFKDNASHGLCIVLFVAACVLFGRLPVVNIRLLLFADFFLRVAAAMAIFKIFRMRPRLMPLWLAAFCALLVADWWMYESVFVVRKLYNPTHYLLFGYTGFYDSQR